MDGRLITEVHQSSRTVPAHDSDLELAEPFPGPFLGNQLPQDDAKAEDVAFGGDTSEGLIEALGSPGYAEERGNSVFRTLAKGTAVLLVISRAQGVRVILHGNVRHLTCKPPSRHQSSWC